jgi:hypothetical protein
MSDRTIVLDTVHEMWRFVDRRVQFRCLFTVDALDRSHSAVVLDPFEDRAREGDWERRERILHRRMHHFNA